MIPAGGIFTGSDAVDMIGIGASAVQVATRFTITKESGLPDKAKQAYFEANEEDIILNTISPTGYPMRMLSQSPCIGSGSKPNCESMGYILDREGTCSYIEAYRLAKEKQPDKISVMDKTCLCTQMRSYKTWTCGQLTSRLKETSQRMDDGTYRQLTTEEVFNDYLYSTTE